MEDFDPLLADERRCYVRQRSQTQEHGISNVMLTKSLKEMEKDGLVTRREYLKVPVRVEYEVTEKAKKLAPILVQMARRKMRNDLF